MSDAIEKLREAIDSPVYMPLDCEYSLGAMVETVVLEPVDACLILAAPKSAEQVRKERDDYREAALDDPAKWSFGALVFMACRMLDEVYHEKVFTDHATELGPAFVAAMRKALRIMAPHYPQALSALAACEPEQKQEG